MASTSPKIPPPLIPPLPREVVELWLDGKYGNGPQRTSAYDRLGWALMLRGFYRYELLAVDGLPPDRDSSVDRHYGYCVFDLVRGELECSGIRVRTGANWGALRYLEPPLLWKSTTCEIKTEATGDSVYLNCVYRLAAVALNSAKDPALEQFRKHLESLPPSLRENGPSDPNKEHEVYPAVRYLSESFERDWIDHKKLISKTPSQPKTPELDEGSVPSLRAAIEDLRRMVEQSTTKEELLVKETFGNKYFDAIHKISSELKDAAKEKDLGAWSEWMYAEATRTQGNFIFGGFLCHLHRSDLKEKEQHPFQFKGQFGAFGKSVQGEIQFTRLDSFRR